MAEQGRTTLKSYFETGDKPTQVQFEDLIDSVVNISDDGTPITNLVEDTTPQLGGNLDLNGNNIGFATAADLTKLNEVTATSRQLNYVDGVTSPIQTQIDGKLSNVVDDTTPQLGGNLDADENNITNVTTFQFAGGTGTQGQMSWNSDEETVDLITNGESINIGQELEYHVRNNSGSTIAKGTPVMATGTIGASGRITISPLASTTLTNAKFFLGIANESIANNEDGKVSAFGKVRQIDTSGSSFTQVSQTWNDGDIIWIDAANDGKLTNVKPTSGMKLPIAFVIDAEANGTLFVRATQGSSISETNDIDFTSLSSSDLLQYNGTKWVNVSGAGLAKIDAVTATSTELNYVDGVTSAIQTQLNSKLTEVSEDTTPQLGGDLDVNGNDITGNPAIDGRRAIITEADTSRTLALEDTGDFIITTSASATTVTIPTNDSVAFTTGTEIDFIQKGAGELTITADGGVTLNGVETGSTAITAQWGGATIKKIDENEWIIVGKINDVA